MRLIQARFTNFRLLRDLTLDFSTDTGKNLIVVRAANESGKTTVLYGLQWALYGNDALPIPRRNFRMHPVNWEASEVTKVPIRVEVDFEIKIFRRSKTYDLIETIRRYRIIRSTYDRIDGAEWYPGPTNAKLFEITSEGSIPQEPPESRIKEQLPENLREVFFTDGDRALSFIDTDIDTKTKRTRVQHAIRSLLGLDVIEEARDRVKTTARGVNTRVRSLVRDNNLARISERITEISDEELELENQIKDAKQQFMSFDERLVEIEKEIEEALSKGNKEEMRKQLNNLRSDVTLIGHDLKKANITHADLLKDVFLSRELSAPMISLGLSKLDALRDQGKIPNSTIPVLEERLTSPFCICGEALNKQDKDSERRRENIKRLIDEARDSDILQGIVTELYYASLSLSMDRTIDRTWISRYEEVAALRDGLLIRSKGLGQQMRSLEVKMDQIPNTDLQILRDTKSSYKKQRDRFNEKWTLLKPDLNNLRQEQTKLISERNRLLKSQQKGDRIMAELEVAQDILTVLSNSYQRLTNEELNKVSNKMNSVFLEMIVADPDQGAIIHKAEITKQFDIIVYGPNGRQLNPNIDLNGASRRALTLAFVLALTKVSEVEAPNVIDTPLGMMEGLVKTSVLTTAIKESSQLILLLTRSEIKNCEEIIDAKAAHIITLTNPAHYPKMLVNEPPSTTGAIVKCGCNHRQECEICQRRAELD